MRIPAKLAGMRRGGGKATRLALALLGGLVVLAAVAQIVLPRLAASRIASHIRRYGEVRSVKVSAWPAIEMLWGDVGSVDVKAGDLSLSPHQAAGLLWEGKGVSNMDLSATSVRVGPLEVQDARLRKRRGVLTAEASTTEGEAQAALPVGVRVSLLGSEEGKVQVQASGDLFGIGASVAAVAEAHEGKLVAHAVGFLIDAFQLTVFSDPHVYVESVGASETSQDPLTYRLSMSARLR